MRSLNLFAAHRSISKSLHVCIVLFCCFFSVCHKDTAKPSVTVTFLDPEWSHDTSQRSVASEAALREFTRQTGVQVIHLPGPENSRDQLAFTQQLLQRGRGGPDVIAIDMVWPGILQQYLTDLKPAFATAIASEDPELISTYSVDNKLLAIPYHTNTGILFYRADLLKKYGFPRPPRTWDELEVMALRIQQGERARGHKDFWGFVWPGAANESLTCNALEWQVSQGGGRIVNADKTIDVNNPETIRAWQRAAHWVGWISPPNVLSYQEWDALNAFHYAGTTAFWRGWMSDYFLSQPVNTTWGGVAGLTSVPGGSWGRVATVGGFGLAVPRASTHPQEAVQLVRFLLGKEQELDEARTRSGPPQAPVLVDLPGVLKAYAQFGLTPGQKPGGSITRPSTVTAEKYDAVSSAYFKAVHSVLSGKVKAKDAAAALQTQLTEITGFPAAPSSRQTCDSRENRACTRNLTYHNGRATVTRPGSVRARRVKQTGSEA
jgi:trehalose/maltose transport system substrate-binding protein